MRVLLIGKRNMLSWVENLSYGLFESGFENKTLFLNELGIIEDIKRNLLKVISKDSMNKNTSRIIEKEINLFKPNLIIVISPFLFNAKIFDCFDNFPNIIKCAWIGDRFSISHSCIANRFDKLFYTDSYFLEEGKEYDFPDGSYLPLAVNPNIFYDRKLKREERLLFIASYTKKRMEFLKQINSTNLRLIGQKWESKDLNNNEEYINKNITLDKVVEEYNLSYFI